VTSADVVVSRTGSATPGGPDELGLMVVDTGAGFDPAAVGPERLGLAESVRGRLAEVDGTLAIWSRPGAGTSALLTVPVGAAPAAARTEPPVGEAPAAPAADAAADEPAGGPA
jgi:hypothetical protein